jgi:hypothetical protein
MPASAEASAAPSQEPAAEKAASAAPGASTSAPAASEAPSSASQEPESAAAELPAPRPGPFRVQLGSFPTPENADLGIGEVRKHAPDLLGEAKLEVVKATLPEKGEVYRIVTAPPSDFTAARALCEAVKSRGADCMLIRMP